MDGGWKSVVGNHRPYLDGMGQCAIVLGRRGLMDRIIKAGDIWYVTLNGGTAVTKLHVCDVTSKTVLLSKCCSEHTDHSSSATRYLKDNVKFVERIQK